MVQIGIPRGLLYYQYYPAARTFFEELGAEVVVSPPTTKVMLAEGSARVVSETCLPVKVFLGHVISLAKECDYLLIPAVRSIRSKIYNCAKFLGLPDMTKAVVPESPPILDIDIDVNKGKDALFQAVHQLGWRFTRNSNKIKQASLASWQAYLDYRKLMSSQGLTPLQAIERLSASSSSQPVSAVPKNSGNGLNIALIGHPYLLYDEYVNHRLIRRLEEWGSRVLTPEMLTSEELESATERLVGKAYWTYEEDVVGAGGHYLQNSVDGVIGIMAFGCGPDSLMMDMVRRRAAKLRSIPFMGLTLDEHTAEGGLITRLEAFLDMLQRRKRVETACV